MNRSFYRNILAALLLIFSWNLVAQSYTQEPAKKPNDPKSPQDPEKKEEEKKKEKTTRMARVILTLGSQDVLEGKIEIPIKLSFQHYKNGLLYTKDFESTELRSIKIVSYRLVKKTKTSKGWFHEFEPAEVQITLDENETFYLDGIFPFLRSFEFTSHDGTVRLFTYFADTLTPSGWIYVNSDDADYHKNNPHPAAVRTFTFPKKS